MSWHTVAAAAIADHWAQHDSHELATLLAILDTDIRPHTVVEIGTARGGSAWAWSRLPWVGHIITIDPAPPPPGWQAAIETAVVTQIAAKSQEAGIPDRVAYLAEPHAVQLLVIDGAHDYPSARADWDAYHRLVAPGGMIVLHDTQDYPGRDDFGVGELWAQVREMYPSVELVSHPGGPCGTGLLWV